VSRRLKLLKKKGIYFLAFAWPAHILLRLWTKITSQKQLKIESAPQSKENLTFLTGLIEQGKIKPEIDRVFPLAQIPEAHRYVESGEKIGHVCVSLDLDVQSSNRTNIENPVEIRKE
jgi:NADPH:quinone reductase-like Zn-dependent oxidoreductase